MSEQFFKQNYQSTTPSVTWVSFQAVSDCFGDQIPYKAKILALLADVANKFSLDVVDRDAGSPAQYSEDLDWPKEFTPTGQGGVSCRSWVKVLYDVDAGADPNELVKEVYAAILAKVPEDNSDELTGGKLALVVVVCLLVGCAACAFLYDQCCKSKKKSRAPSGGRFSVLTSSSAASGSNPATSGPTVMAPVVGTHGQPVRLVVARRAGTGGS